MGDVTLEIESSPAEPGASAATQVDVLLDALNGAPKVYKDRLTGMLVVGRCRSDSMRVRTSVRGGEVKRPEVRGGPELSLDSVSGVAQRRFEEMGKRVMSAEGAVTTRTDCKMLSAASQELKDSGGRSNNMMKRGRIGL